MIKKLIKLANYLDDKGFRKEAGILISIANDIDPSPTFDLDKAIFNLDQAKIDRYLEKLELQIDNVLSSNESDHTSYKEEFSEGVEPRKSPAEDRTADRIKITYSPRPYNHCDEVINFGNKGWGGLSNENYLSYIGCLILDNPNAEKDSFLFNLSDVYSLDKVKKNSGTGYSPDELNDYYKAIVNEKYKTLSEKMKRRLDSIIDPDNKLKVD